MLYRSHIGKTGPLIAFSLGLCVWSQLSASPPPQYTIHRTRTPPKIDGQLESTVWAVVPSVGKFHFPWWTAGKREQTRAQLLWDDDCLYLAYRCEDAHIWATHTERDSPVYRDDCVELFTAPNPAQPQNYFNIEMNVRRAFLDRHHPDGPGRKPVKNWNATGVRIATRVQGTLNDDSDEDQYWILEAAIPLKNFQSVAQHTPPHSGDVWHVNLNRLGGKTNPQHSQWSPGRSPKPAFHAPQYFGRMRFSDRTLPIRPR